LLNGNSDFVEITLTDQKIVIHKKTAIVRHKLSAKTNDKGKSPGEVNLHIMTVWVKQGKIWKLLARQAIKIA
jgi:ketosteroid isomerase-like protein